MLSTIRNLFEKKNQKKKRSKRDRLNVESLEKRDMMTAIALTDYEQLSLELINRARANPLAEVALNPLRRRQRASESWDRSTLNIP